VVHVGRGHGELGRGEQGRGTGREETRFADHAYILAGSPEITNSGNSVGIYRLFAGQR
jgi:hypothetical protein